MLEDCEAVMAGRCDQITDTALGHSGALVETTQALPRGAEVKASRLARRLCGALFRRPDQSVARARVTA